MAKSRKPTQKASVSIKSTNPYSPGHPSMLLPLAAILLLVGFLAGYVLATRHSRPVEPRGAHKSTDWKTYVNATYGFSLKIPSDFETYEYPQEQTPDHTEGDISFTEENADRTTINVDIQKTQLTVDEWITEARLCPSDGPVTCIDKQAGPIEGSVQFRSIGGNFASVDTLVAHNGFIYDITLAATSQDKRLTNDDYAMYAKSLSTFAFTN